MTHMIIAGITGGIGSGKTAVCELLEEQGASVFYADSVARKLMQSDDGIRRQIVVAFGRESYLGDGTLNRSYLADLIFSSETERLQMNAIVHPAVGAAFRDSCEQARTKGGSFLFKEAALLFEAGTSDLDAVVVVNAPVETRITRVMKRDGLTRAEVVSRMAGQMNPARMCERADYVIENSGNFGHLEVQVHDLVQKLTYRVTGETN